MRALRLALTSALLGLTALACAPVQTKTHFQRWDEHSAKLAAEEAAAPAATPGSGVKGGATPAPTAPAPTASASPGGTRTATASSRVVRPQDTPPPAEEDVIY
jgi:hypothetical protein